MADMNFNIEQLEAQVAFLEAQLSRARARLEHAREERESTNQQKGGRKRKRAKEPGGIYVMAGGQPQAAPGVPNESTTASQNDDGTKKKKPKRVRERFYYYCKVEGCDKSVQKAGGFCRTHGPPLPKCSFLGCSNQAVRDGVCGRHGAARRCKVPGCERQLQRYGVCRKHEREGLGNEPAR